MFVKMSAVLQWNKHTDSMFDIEQLRRTENIHDIFTMLFFCIYIVLDPQMPINAPTNVKMLLFICSKLDITKYQMQHYLICIYGSVVYLSVEVYS